MQRSVLFLVLVCLPATAYAQSEDFVTIEASHMTIQGARISGGEADCPAGYAVVSGGFMFSDADLVVVESRPFRGKSPTGRQLAAEQEGWAAFVRSETGNVRPLIVYARCMRTSGGDTPPDPTPTGALLFDDFSNSTLPQWVGKNEGAHSGTVVTDPLSFGNKVLRITDVVPAGDMFSPPITVTPGQEYALCFDYLGTPVYTGGFGNGGAIGIAAGTPGNHRWLAGTYKAGGIEQDLLVDDGTWQAVRVTFYPEIAGSSVSSLRIMLEDFTGVEGDVYFDNMKLVPATEGC